jgi:ADP-heptose:LPS heptosyltransferase
VLSIVVPAFNEEENIARVIRNIEGLVDIEHELIIVNDHSFDRTPLIVKELSREYSNLELVDNTGDKGFAYALRFGFSHAKGELIVPVMADFCDDLSTLKDMIKKINEGYDVVCASRYIKGGGRLGGSKIKGSLSLFTGWSLYHLLGIPTHDIANAFKMYRKKVIDNVDIKAAGFEISMELPLKAYYAGFKITEVPTVWRERQKGKSNFKMFKLIPAYLGLYLWAIIKKFSPQLEKDKIKNILAVRNDRFGEFLLNIPALRALKRTYPKANLVLAVNASVKELAGAVEYADKTVVWDEEFRKTIRKHRFGLCVVLNPTKEAHWYCFLSGIPIRVGYDRKWGFLLTHKLKDTKHIGDRHEVECNLELVGLVGAKTEDKSLSIKVKDKVFPELRGEKIVAIHPFTSDMVKLWPAERFRELAKRISDELKLKVLIIGKDEFMGKDSFDNMGSNVVNRINKTSLIELAQILKNCQLLVSCDSGPVHLSCAVGTSVLVLFRNDLPGKTSKRWGPWLPEAQVIEKPSLSAISVDEVFLKIREMLETKESLTRLKISGIVN